jgi:hypothetical protein
VYASLYPALNDYIKKVLTEALSLMNSCKLKRIELRIHREETTYESYFIDVNTESVYKPSEELEDEFRDSIFSLETRLKSFRRLSKECRFKLLLHAKSFDFSDESRILDSLWIKDIPDDDAKDGSIVPISMKSRNSLVKFYVERFRK